jgi:hypothetical protein
MRPTVEEQLRGTCRILENVVAPCVSEPFARTILDGLVANLRMLAAALPAVAGFLRYDNEATLGLLSALREALAPELAARIDQAMAIPEPDVVDGPALAERNRILRELLAAAVCSAALAPDMHRSILQHMIDRASRVPMRYVPTAPVPAKALTEES